MYFICINFFNSNCTEGRSLISPLSPHCLYSLFSMLCLPSYTLSLSFWELLPVASCQLAVACCAHTKCNAQKVIVIICVELLYWLLLDCQSINSCHGKMLRSLHTHTHTHTSLCNALTGLAITAKVKAKAERKAKGILYIGGPLNTRVSLNIIHNAAFLDSAWAADLLRLSHRHAHTQAHTHSCRQHDTWAGAHFEVSRKQITQARRLCCCSLLFSAVLLVVVVFPILLPSSPTHTHTHTAMHYKLDH